MFHHAQSQMTSREISTKGEIAGVHQWVALVLLFAVAGRATADVAYDTFGPSDSFHTSNFWENGPSGVVGGFTAMPFDLGAGDLTNITVTLPLAHSFLGDPGSLAFHLNIYADNGTPSNPGDFPGVHSPGDILATINGLASDLPEPQLDAVPLTTFDFGSLTLAGNTRYWLAIETSMDSELLFTSVWWFVNDQGVDGFKAQRAAQYPYTTFPDDWYVFAAGDGGAHGAMRISGTAVPAPTGAVPLLFGLGIRCRRRRS